MHFMRVGEAGAEIPVLLVDEVAYDLRSMCQDINPEFLSTEGLVRAREAFLQGELPSISIAGLRVGAPVASPKAVMCIGQNYVAHAAESGSAPPTEPIIFYKHPDCIVGPFDDVRLPPGALRCDWEVELAVVLGRQARLLDTPEDALACVAGYMVSNDVSEREYQLVNSGGQWSKGKSWETFNPLGPWLVPAWEVPDVQDLRLRSFVNGEPRQDSNTRDMIFSVAEIIRHLSHFVMMQPGDVINTGTPQGVALSGRFPYLKQGDQMRIEIDGLGSQEQRCIS